MNPSLSIPDGIDQFGSDMVIAAEAARQAGERIIRGWGKAVQIEEKGVGDLVSVVDRECDELVHILLEKERPDDAVLSEEISPNVKENGSRLWVIDPMDGSVPFLFKADPRLISVMISLRDQMETQLSIVLFPLTGEWFYAAKEKGAYLNGQILDNSHVGSDLGKSWVMMNHQSNAENESDEFRKLDKDLRSGRGARAVTRELPNAGGNVRLLADAWPNAVAFVHDNSPKYVKQGPWDIIPPELIVREAGGVMLNAKGMLVDPFKPEMVIAAANAAIANQIIELLPRASSLAMEGVDLAAGVHARRW